MSLDAIGRYFDHYVISARIKPAFFVVIPIVITVLAWWPEASKLGGAALTFLTTFGVIGFLSNLISNQGNKLQNRLFTKWGGAPTVALLRFSNLELDPYTKSRYHRQLEAVIPDLIMPNREQEQEDPKDADARYESATNYMRERCRDKTKYPLLYADNVAYGYARNLLLMKPWGIATAALAITVNVAQLYPEVANYMREGFNYSFDLKTQIGLLNTSLSLFMLGLFLLVINQGYVRARAVRYAKSLFACSEVLNVHGKSKSN